MASWYPDIERDERRELTELRLDDEDDQREDELTRRCWMSAFQEWEPASD